MTNKPHTETTSADKTSLGFDFQYYFFILKLLYLKPQQSIGLEVKEDVHTELDNDCQIFYQVKHTVHENKNLQTRDIDLWKTLSNWSKVITDKNDARHKICNQVNFIEKSEFILFSNKLHSDNNELINLILSLKELSVGADDLVKGLNTIKEGTKDSSAIMSYIDDVVKLDNSVLYQFFLKIGFELGEEDIFNKIYVALKSKMVDEKNIEQVFRDLDSDMRRDNFITIKSGGKFQLSFDDFYQKYKIYFHPISNKLPIRPIATVLPSIPEMKEQIFIKQLLDLKDFETDDFEELSRLTTCKLKLENNIFQWYEQGEITHNKCEEFHTNTKNIWKNILNRKKRKGLDNDKSLEIIDELREKELKIDGQQLNIEMSNGEFYYLSNLPEIGWVLDWEKYK